MRAPTPFSHIYNSFAVSIAIFRFSAIPGVVEAQPLSCIARGSRLSTTLRFVASEGKTESGSRRGA